MLPLPDFFFLNALLNFCFLLEFDTEGLLIPLGIPADSKFIGMCTDGFLNIMSPRLNLLLQILLIHILLEDKMKYYSQLVEHTLQ